MKILFFITKAYSLSILKPIESYCSSSPKLKCAWFKAGSAKELDFMGHILVNSDQVLDYNPDAIIVPGNVVPDFWPGLKVQIFHGLCEEKKGHYNITGFFDLYCTPPLLSDNMVQVREKVFLRNIQIQIHMYCFRQNIYCFE